MNANELADYIETGGENIDRKELATMLRQQQTEIQALKGDGKVCARCGAIAYDPVITQTAKTLTDEEIIEMVDDAGIKCGDSQAVYFARAILRKAQEK